MRQAKQGNGRGLTRVGLREAVYNCRAGLSRAEASEICEAVINEICEALARGEPVQLRGFGSFNIRTKRGRIGRNPRTGVEAPITLVAQLNCETVAGREAERECSKDFSDYAERLT